MAYRHHKRTRDDIANDTRLLTPLILMGLVIVAGLLFFAYQGAHAATAQQIGTIASG